MINLIERLKRVPPVTFIYVFLSLVLIVFYFLYNSVEKEKEYLESEFEFIEQKSKEDEDISVQNSPVPPLPELIYVDVKGAVAKPDVYETESDKRINDVIEMAGGFTIDADQDRVNLAARVKDEMLIYVPVIGEEPNSSFVVTGIENNSNDLININSATSEQLQKLPGIGPSKADAIIKYREEKGPFKSGSDLLNISGIGEKSLEKLVDLIRINFIFRI